PPGGKRQLRMDACVGNESDEHRLARRCSRRNRACDPARRPIGLSTRTTLLVALAMNLTWVYVALLYAAAVWIARRSGAAFPWRIAALFYALVLIFLWHPMTGEYVNLPVDIVQQLPPWSAMIRDHRVANFELNDIVMQIVPWAHQVREAWKSLHFPLWNALSGSGYPLLANGQSSGLSPIRL